MTIRKATGQDWPRIYPIYAAVMAEGRTYPFPEQQTLDEARSWWMEEPPGQTVVAVTGDDTITGSAKMGPNRPGRGAHIATASFIVNPARQGRGIGRALGEYFLSWARAGQFLAPFRGHGRQPPGRTPLIGGVRLIGTVAEAFDTPTTPGRPPRHVPETLTRHAIVIMGLLLPWPQQPHDHDAPVPSK